MSENKAKLRAHHILCLSLFEGRGYSERFVKAMTDMQVKLNNCPDTQVTLTAAPDSLCENCPRLEHECRDKPHRYDLAVLAALRLKEGDTRGWAELQKAAREKILEPNKLTDICPNCEWSQLCAEIFERKPRH